jgi:hypothetical protein
MRAAISSDDAIVGIWNNLTPLARNEWICWTISVKRREDTDRSLATNERRFGKRKASSRAASLAVRIGLRLSGRIVTAGL